MKFTDPGTPTRPILSEQEAAQFTPSHYLTLPAEETQLKAHAWCPEAILTDNVQTPFTVGPDINTNGAQYTHIQQAINAALRENNSHQRIYIRLLPGTYTGTVYIPANAPPITLFGAGRDAANVVIQLALDATMSPAAYQTIVNSNGEYQPNDPAWNMYSMCAFQQKETIDTHCAAVMWSQSENFQLKNLTVINTLLDTVDGGAHQGVALRIDGDKTQLENVRLIGRHDTFFVNTSDINNRYVTDRYSRAYIKDCYIEGDVDYVFGRAMAVFDNVEFHTVSSRGAGEAYVLAPNSLPWIKYGFLVINSRFTGDAGFANQRKAKLGRAWDQGARQTGYLPGKTANGQLVIRDSYIDASYDREHPWGAAATTRRPFIGNHHANRDLNDISFNRLWEYNNMQAT